MVEPEDREAAEALQHAFWRMGPPDAVAQIAASIRERAIAEERAAVVAWLRDTKFPTVDMDVISMGWSDQIAAGAHRKGEGA